MLRKYYDAISSDCKVNKCVYMCVQAHLGMYISLFSGPILMFAYVYKNCLAHRNLDNLDIKRHLSRKEKT